VNNGLCKNTDKLTASASRAALVDFYSKFPELKGNDFFITGESYGRIVIPYPRHLSLSLLPLRSSRTYTHPGLHPSIRPSLTLSLPPLRERERERERE
jgi:hypothetical protein